MSMAERTKSSTTSILAVYLFGFQLLVQPSDSGYCARPPPGLLEYCDITYPIYSLSKETDVDALVAMDRAAEKLASALFFRGGCDAVGAEATCRPYVCANFFLRCDEDGTAPMPVCRSECVICLQTCRYERTILAPGALLDRDEYLLLGKREAREDPMRGQKYDKMIPDYKCAADRKLSGPLRDSIFVTHLGLFSRQCTSGSSKQAVTSPLSLLLLLINLAFSISRILD